MMKILVTGANSYIGQAFKKYMSQWTDVYLVDTIHMTDGSWEKVSFSGYDVVVHVAGIAHIKETLKNAHLYYEVNCDLVRAVADKAKSEGVKQFIFLSSMSVYGINVGIITKDTVPNPKTHYGKSKFMAEQLLDLRCSEHFHIAIIRAPMVYGMNCPGNFQSIIKIVKKTPVFPLLINHRSMIYIINLCEFIKILIDQNKIGIFFPQNKEYMSTSNMAKWIAENKNQKLYLSSILGLIVLIFRPFVKTLQKAFGSLIYKDTEDFNYSYCLVNERKSIRESVGE